jgi:site-specific DNA recombinase
VTVAETSTLAVYMRVSSDEQREQGTIQTQQSASERYLALHDLQAAWYADDGVSGTIPFEKRPEGRRLLADAQAGHVETLLVYRLDRLGRNALAVLKAIEALEQAHVRLVSITEAFDTSTPAGRLQQNMLAVIAQFERDSIVQRISEGKRRRLREGKWMGGRCPYGYRAEGRDKDAHLVIVDEEAEVVRQVFRLYVGQRYSLRRVCRALNDADVPTQFLSVGRAYHRGNEQRPALGVWRPPSILNMLRNPAYKGEADYNGQSVMVPAIVPAEMWEAAQALLTAARVHSGGHNATYPYLLHSLVRCAACGRLFAGVSIRGQSSGAPHTFHYYICNGKRRARALFKRGRAGEGERCESPTVDAEWLEGEIWADVERYVRNPEQTLTLLAARVNGAADQSEAIRRDIAACQRELDGLQGERDAILGLFRKQRISERDLGRQLDALDGEQSSIHAKTRTLQEQAASASDAADRLLSARAILERLAALLDSGDPAVRRELIEGLVASITVDREPTGRTGRAHYQPVVRVVYVFSELGAQVQTNICSKLPLRVPAGRWGRP